MGKVRGVQQNKAPGTKCVLGMIKLEEIFISSGDGKFTGLEGGAW